MLVQFSFVRHPRMTDLHQSLNDVFGCTVDDARDIDALFSAAEHGTINSDADLLRAGRRFEIVRPHLWGVVCVRSV